MMLGLELRRNRGVRCIRFDTPIVSPSTNKETALAQQTE